MKNKLLLLGYTFLLSIFIFSGITSAQPMSGDYTVGVSLFRQLSGNDISFEKRIRVIEIEEFQNEASLNQEKAERGENGFEDDVLVKRTVTQEYFVPVFNSKEYSGSLYHEFTSNQKLMYNLRGGGVYATITAAKNDLIVRGVNGPVRFLLLDANYPSESIPIVIPAITGASDVNTITILPDVDVTTSISVSISQPIFDMDGCSYFIFDGRQNGVGSANSFTFTNNSTASGSGHIRFINGSTNNIVRYMNFVGMPSSSTTRIIEFSTSATNPSGNSNNLITNCNINGARYGIYSSGTAANPNSNNIISNNNIADVIFGHFFFASNASSTTIEYNEIYQTTPGNATNSAMQINAGNHGDNYFRYNKVYDIQNSLSSAVRGIYIFGGSVGTVWNIENNFISMTLNNGTKTIHNGINISGGEYTVNLFYNTVRIGGIHSGGTAGSAVSACVFKNTSNVASVWNSKNNIFYNTRSGGNAGVIHVGANYNNISGINDIDFNNYYAAGDPNSFNVIWDGINFNNLNDYKLAMAPLGLEQNSVFKETFFVSNTDLHLIGSSNGDFDLAGTPIAGITVDIDGDLRHETYPYIGADEASIPLPVELISFTADVSSNNVTLKWTTSTEINNSGFQVERFSDNKWNELGFVDGAGTTTETVTYTFVDRNVTTGKYLYRLKQIDFDGSYEYSNVIEVDVSFPEYFELSQNYPNPFNPGTIIEYRLAAGSNVTLKIYNSIGEEIETLVNKYHEAGTYSIFYNMNTSLASGVYIYRLQADNFSDFRKMILLR